MPLDEVQDELRLPEMRMVTMVALNLKVNLKVNLKGQVEPSIPGNGLVVATLPNQPRALGSPGSFGPAEARHESPLRQSDRTRFRPML